MAKPWEKYQGQELPQAPQAGAAVKPWEKYQAEQSLPTQSVAMHPPQAEASDEGSMMAALQGYGQGPLLGYLPNIQARVAQAGQAVLPESMGGRGNDSYEALKKQFQRRDAALKEQHPLASMAGNISGTVMAAPIGGMAARGLGGAIRGAQAVSAAAPAAELLAAPVAELTGAAGEAASNLPAVIPEAVKKASFLARLGKATGGGAAIGGLTNPEMEADPNNPNGEMMARLNNAILGGITGGAGEGVISGIGNTLEKAGTRMANKAVVKQIGANAGQIKNILKKDEIPKLESFLSKEGLMGVGTNLEDVADHSKQILATDGPKIGQLYKNAQGAAEALAARDGAAARPLQISGPELADQIVNKVKASVKNHPDRNMVVSQIEESVGPLRDMGKNANIADLHDFRKGLDENIDWTKSSREKDAVQRAYVSARNTVADKIKGTIDNLDSTLNYGEPKGLLDKLKTLNDRFSAASTVNNISTQGLAREQAKAFMGHGIIGAGAGVGGGAIEWNRSHDPVKAIAAGLATTLGVGAARKFGTPVGFYGGKAIRGAGRALAPVGENAAVSGAAAASPWVNMNRREDYGK